MFIFNSHISNKIGLCDKRHNDIVYQSRHWNVNITDGLISFFAQHIMISHYSHKYGLKKKYHFHSLCVWNFLNGSTIAKNLSALNAVSVKTDTPIERSLINSDAEHMVCPHGQESIAYTTATNGTLNSTTNKSATANDRMYL